MPLSIPEFVHRWKISAQSERSTAQSHFIDLCDTLGESHPAAADSIGERYAFEKAVTRTEGGKGFADVWLRDHFAWEYKGRHKDLKKAYEQLNDYREDLGNPPLLVVSDMDRFQVHTNFERTYSLTSGHRELLGEPTFAYLKPLTICTLGTVNRRYGSEFTTKCSNR
jgi:hypothetical protein